MRLFKFFSMGAMMTVTSDIGENRRFDICRTCFARQTHRQIVVYFLNEKQKERNRNRLDDCELAILIVLFIGFHGIVQHDRSEKQ